MNPEIVQEFNCDKCRCRLEQTYARFANLVESIQMMTCGNKSCSNHGEVLVFHPAKWNRQVFGELARFVVPGTPAAMKDHMRFTGFAPSPSREGATR